MDQASAATRQRVILHIGHLKTASSSIQNCLYDNREQLFDAGINYVDQHLSRERRIGVRHYHLAKVDEDFSSRWADIANTIRSDAKPVNIVSYEGLIRLDRELLEQIANELSEFAVEIVVFLRRQDRFFESLFAEYIQHHNYAGSYLDFRSLFRHLGNYASILSNWQEVFGSTILVNNFDQLKADKVNVVRHFLSLVGVTESLTGERSRVNPSVPVSRLEELWQVNIDKSLTPRARERLVQSLLIPCQQAAKASLLSAEEARGLVGSFAQENRQLAGWGLKFDDCFHSDISFVSEKFRGEPVAPPAPTGFARRTGLVLSSLKRCIGDILIK